MTADDTVTATPVAWRDGYGRTYWQPATSDGRELWEWSAYGDDMWGPGRERGWLDSPPNVRGWASLYRSRKRAERVTRRYLDRTLRDTLSRVERVDD